MSRPRNFTKILITAGPTREKLDSVRFISNRSSGNMGYEITKAALKRGYKVTLISGPTNLNAPKGAHFIRTEGAGDMYKAVKKNFRSSDCLFMASAVCDWRPRRIVRGKIKKGPKSVSLRLVETPDILGSVGKRKDGKVLVGFALESSNLVKNAKEKLEKKNLDFIVANRMGKRLTPFGGGPTDVTIIDKYGAKESIANTTKARIAGRLLDKAEKIWQEERR
ncbi:MAG: phosphopantothenoylcysteine decarboxylase [Candidatus Omnitrophica bacterium]|nr:phosphopantothenoylcysteine decarboxylase [Candidatus Omnitrophota bacterium]